MLKLAPLLPDNCTVRTQVPDVQAVIHSNTLHSEDRYTGHGREQSAQPTGRFGAHSHRWLHTKSDTTAAPTKKTSLLQRSARAAAAKCGLPPGWLVSTPHLAVLQHQVSHLSSGAILQQPGGSR